MVTDKLRKYVLPNIPYGLYPLHPQNVEEFFAQIEQWNDEDEYLPMNCMSGK